MLIGFVCGLSIGMLGLLLYRLRIRRLLRRLLHEAGTGQSQSALSPVYQLSGAIAYQNQQCADLSEQVRHYQLVLEQAPIAFLHVDDENRLVWCNKRAQILFKVVQNPEPSRLLLELIRSFELDQLIDEARQSQALTTLDWTFFPLNTDPSRILKQRSYALRGHGFPFLDQQIGVFIENRQEIALLKQQRDRWTSDVAHELKTPLTSIRLIAETLQSRLDPGLVGWANRLVTQSTRLSGLVQDLLDLSQLEIDVDQPESLPLTAVNVPDLIQSAWTNLEPIARGKQLQLNYCGATALIADLDESRIYRVFINLLDNAIKYSPPQGRITVTVNLEGRSAQPQTGQPDVDPDPQIPQESSFHIGILDEGPGFQPQDIPHIFERFYRSDESRTRLSERSSSPNGHATASPSTIPAFSAEKQGTNVGDRPPPAAGTGLGLAIVQQIILAHGGTITAQNHPDAGGALVRIQLPHRTSSVL